MRHLVVIVITLLVFWSCSGLKLDLNSNCLNPQAPCFKNDITPPQFVSSAPSITAQYTVLDHVDITFSEEPKNGESTDAYVLSGSGFAPGYKIQYVQKIAQYTYRIFLGGASLQTGNIDISFAGIIDYGGNYLTGPNKVSYQGSSNVPITLTVTYSGAVVNGVSNNGGGAYSNVDISFSHQFTADNANNYSIYLTTGATVCSGTLIGSGTNLAANVITTPINKLATFFPAPLNRIVVCVTNQNNPTATGTASWALIRDDVPPVMTNDIPPDSYPLPQTITLTCSDNMDRIAITSAAQQGSAPAVPVDPGFDAVGNLNGTSTLYAGSVKAQNPANPTYTIFSWQCIDKSGNRSALTPAVTKGMQYYIDNTIPAVNLVADPTFRRYIGPANATTNFMFTTDQANKTYNIWRNGTSCAGGGNGTLLATGTTPATPGTTITQALNTTTHFPGPNAVYPVRICVQGPTLWGTAFVQITTDSSVPTITATVPSGTYGAVQSVVFNCSDTNIDKSAYTFTTQLGSVAPAAPFAPTFNTTTGAITSINTFTGAFATPDSSTSVALYACIDLAGNQGSGGPVQYTVDSSIPSVTVVSLDHTGVTTNAGAYNSVNITWNTSRAGTGYPGNNYDIRVGATNCATGSVVQSGLTPATPNTNVVTNLPAANFPTNGTSYGIMICVKNYAGAQGYQTSTLSVMRDDTAPIFSGLNSIGPAGSGAFTLGWPTATDSNSGIGVYRIYQSTTSLTYAATPDFVATAPANNFTVTGLNPLTTYYYVAGAVDNAGNETKVVTLAAEMPTKPTITLIVTGLSGNFTLTDGTSTNTISANTAGSPWVTVLGTGAAYNFSFTTQPAGQVCAIRENPHGSLSANVTLTINCVAGYAVGGRYQQISAAALNYMLYRGKTSTVYSGISVAITGVVATGSTLYYSERDGSNNNVLKKCTVGSCTGTIISNTITGGRFRQLATDGTSIYVAFDDLGGTGDKIYKYNASASGASNPVVVYNLNSGGTATYPSGLALDVGRNLLYTGLRGVDTILRIHLDTGVIDTITGSLSGVDFEGLALVGNDLYLAAPDPGNCILKMTAADTATDVSIYAGTCSATAAYSDAPIALALFAGPLGLASDGTDLYVAEFDGKRVRRINLRNGIVSTLAGSGTAGATDGTGVAATFGSINQITTDGREFFTADVSGYIRRIGDVGIVGYWPVVPGSVSNDYSSDAANIKNGTANTPLGSATDRFGNANAAAAFDGTQRVVAGDGGLPMGSSTRTMCAWIKPNALPAANWAVFLAYGSTGANQGAGLNLYNGSAYGATGNYVVFFGYGAGPATDFAIPYTTSTTQWTHICGSYYNGTATIFINGHKMGSQGGFAWNTLSSGILNIGQQLTNTQGFNGAIADVRIYNRVLNEGEINELAQDAASAQVEPSYNSGATGLLAQFDYTATSPVSTGPIGGTMAPACSNPIGKDGDAGGACYLDGTTNMTATGKSIGAPWGNAPRSLCIWFKPASMPTNKVLLAYGNPIAQQGFGMTLVSPTQAQLWNWGGSAVNFNYNVQLNTWQHLCGTLSGTTVQLFANGQLIGTNTGTIGTVNTVNNSGSLLSMGSNLNGNVGNIFNGTLDDARIYNNVLTPMQVRQLATQVPSGLVARLDMNGDANDASGQNQTLLANTGSLAAGRSGSPNTAYRFANGQQITIADRAELNPNMNATWSFWMKSPSISALTTEIFSKYSAGTGWVFKYDQVNYMHGWTAASPGQGAFTNSTPVRADNVWNHYAFVRSGATMTIYMNGASISNTQSGNGNALLPSGVNLQFGVMGTGDMTAQDARLYNRALAGAEIRALAGYHPMQVTGGVLRMHMNAESLSNLSSGSQITQWNDVSTSGIVLSQAVPALQPLYSATGINGKSGVDFNGHYLATPCNSALNSSANTVLGAFYQPSASGMFQTVFEHGNKLLYFNGTNNQLDLFHDGVGPSSFPVVQSQNSFLALGGSNPNMIFAIEHDGTSGNVYKNGSNVTLSSGALGAYPYSCAGTATVGWVSWGPNFFNGLIGEIIYFDQSITGVSVYGANTEREVVDCYLSSKYGLGLAHTCP